MHCAVADEPQRPVARGLVILSAMVGGLALGPTAARADEPLRRAALVCSDEIDARACTATAARLHELAVTRRIEVLEDDVAATLRGRGTTEPWRARRHELPRDEAQASATFDQWNESLHVDALVWVRSAPATTEREGDAAPTEIVIYVPEEHSFFDGNLAWPADRERLSTYVERRIQAATPRPRPSFFEEAWPYAAAGALLLGGIIFVVVSNQGGSTPQPMLRFQPGGPDA